MGICYSRYYQCDNCQRILHKDGPKILYSFSGCGKYHNKLTNINVNVNNKAKVVMNWFDGKFPNSLPPPDLSLDTAISIVDGANDVPLFDICKLNIAFNAQEIVKNNANVIINKKNLLEILPHVKKILS